MGSGDGVVDGGVDAVTTAALDGFLELPGARRVGLALIEGGGRRLRFTASDRVGAAPLEWCHIDAYDDVPLTTVVRTGDPMVGDLGSLDPRFADFAAHQRAASTSALAALPLVAAGNPVGGVVLFYAEPQPFDEEQHQALAGAAVRVAEDLRGAQAVTARRDPGPDQGAAEEAGRHAWLQVGGEPQSVGAARRFLRDRLSGWGVDDDTLDTAVLCLSELVTNTVIHTHAPAQVRATLDDDVLTVVVRDHGSGLERSAGAAGPQERPDPLRVHGRGLQLVEGLTDRWGSELDAEGTTVWFVLEAETLGAGRT